jgi:uncharacterized YigZ family protein
LPAFQTIAAPSEGLYKEKGSRFLGFAYSVSTEEEIKDILLILKKDHPKSRHVCYAYCLGAGKSIYKSSDAGEPHNSAGAPILGQIRSFDLTNVLVIVVRYFGGTKLGIGGLTAAYKEAAHDALKNAVIVDDIEIAKLKLETDYAHLTELMNFVKQNNVRILGQELAESCVIQISIPVENMDAVKSALSQMQRVRIYD